MRGARIVFGGVGIGRNEKIQRIGWVRSEAAISCCANRGQRRLRVGGDVSAASASTASNVRSRWVDVARGVRMWRDQTLQKSGPYALPTLFDGLFGKIQYCLLPLRFDVN